MGSRKKTPRLLNTPNDLGFSQKSSVKKSVRKTGANVVAMSELGFDDKTGMSLGFFNDINKNDGFRKERK